MMTPSAHPTKCGSDKPIAAMKMQNIIKAENDCVVADPLPA
jgi:hypothetical protein